MRATRDALSGVRCEGGLLPPDVLVRIAAQDPQLGGLAPADYHLGPSERIGEAIARSWARLRVAWDAFSAEEATLATRDRGGRATRERWLLPLFAELGYGRLPARSPVEIEGTLYPVFTEWHRSPIHLVGADVPLDRRSPGVEGAARQSPHSLVQELLNRSADRLWAIVSNGLSLRLLRDNVALTRQAFVEFDLEAIFAGEAYAEFALLWLCCHQSRLEAAEAESCWLERWTQAAQRDGTRALDQLRDGVMRAIEVLGRGFLAQPANLALHEELRTGGLGPDGYYRQLLRLVYRLLFLFVAEDRDALLLPRDGTAERDLARRRFAAHYGTRRLRRLAARRRGGRAHDIYEQVKLLSGWLHEDGQPALALPALGSALWDPGTTSHIASARISNDALLEALRELAYVEGGRRPVDFRNLGAEELGSIYESLLEMHPGIEREAASFTLKVAGGNERKTTGSYYTPTSLIGSLLETALDPVIDRAVAQADPEQALLALTVCDPACGSGHFLIAAAHRIAKRLAAIREQDSEPPPEAIRHAMRDVVPRCIYGVDVNPMAVELCKVSLWLEALEPGRPLSFLDDRVLCGNSLLGTTPALVAGGVPDDAYKPLLGDDGDTAKAWRLHNRRERSGQTAFPVEIVDAERDAAALTAVAMLQSAIDDSSIEGVHRREQTYEALRTSTEHERLALAADAWCAAFTTPKRRGEARVTTDAVRRAAAHGAAGLTPEERAAIDRERRTYAFLHWHVAFPGVFRAGTSQGDLHGWTGGFDCLLGNPPWERVKLVEKEFFATSAPEIAEARRKAERERLIDELAEHEDPDRRALHAAFVDAKRSAEGQSHLLRSTGRYPLCGRGDVNTYAVFAECMRSLLAPTGRLGAIVPTGIATDDTTKLFFADLMERGSLVSLFDFENAAPLFPAVHRSYKFSLLTLAGPARRAGSPGEFAFFLRSADELLEADRRFALTSADTALLNPNTRTCPVFRSRRDAEIAKRIYSRAPALVREQSADGNPWGIRLSTMFHMSNDSGLFHTREQLESAGWRLSGNVFAKDGEQMLPLYEAKMIDLYDHRHASVVLSRTAVVRQGQQEYLTDRAHQDPDVVAMPRAWVPAANVDALLDSRRTTLIAVRDVTSSLNERTVIATVIPRAAVGNSLFLLQIDSDDARMEAFLVACLSSFVFDYCARLKVGGLHLNFFLFKQLPVLQPDIATRSCAWSPGETNAEWVARRVAELAVTANELAPFGERISGAPAVHRWDPARRTSLEADLDAAFFHLYGVERDVVDHILDSFSIVRRKDEERYDEFRTKRLILDAYDALAAASEDRRAEVGGAVS